jgi:subtilisin family serine protease
MSAYRSGRRWRRLITGLIGLTLVGASLAGTPDTASAGTRHRYLVKTASGSDVARPLAKARQSGGTVLTRLSRTMSGFTAELTPAQAVRLAGDPSVTDVVADVAYTVDDQQVSTTASQSGPPWGLDRIDQRTPALDGRYDYLTAGSGGTAFVIDSGIRLTHSQFGGRAVSGWDFVGGDANASDCAGHGTHVAGTIGGSTYGVAKGVRLVSVRVLDAFDCMVSIDGRDEVPMQRYASPDEIAPVALLLASEAGSFITGSVFVVDGGYTLWGEFASGLLG